MLAIGRLDQALASHPLLPAFLYRARLEAVRRQAAVDGHAIDPWHLAAVLEGLRLRMDHALRIVDRGAIFEAARTALTLHQWLVEPDSDQEAEVQAAERLFTGAASVRDLAGALWDWLEQGGGRAPARTALVREWRRRGMLHAAVPLTAPRALSADAPEDREAWIPSFFYALEEEALGQLNMLRQLEHGWLAARGRVRGTRRTSRAGLAIDVLAATPLISATTLGRAIDMSVKSAGTLLDSLVADGIAVEVTHRAARRLFGMSALAPMRDATPGPKRPQPGRGRGRPRDGVTIEMGVEDGLPTAAPTRLRHPPIDYAALELAMSQCDAVVRAARVALQDSLRPSRNKSSTS